MHKTVSPVPYVVGTIALLAIGHWWFNLRKPEPLVPPPTVVQSPSPTFPPPSSVPGGTVVDIDGSTSMVALNQTLKTAFERQFPGTTVATQANGSNRGLERLQRGEIDIAALSRPLTAAEQQQGLQAVQVGRDAIAIVVGRDNPFQGSLTPAQVQAIFQGKITNWQQVGGTNQPLRVINRPAASGTRQAFQELVLQGGDFGQTPNITTLTQDATTPLFRALGTDGIGYATEVQARSQQTVRSLAIAGKRPDQPAYPYQRSLYYAYQVPVSDVAKEFLGFALAQPQN